MKKLTIIRVLFGLLVLVALSVFFISTRTVTFLYLNPYTETAGMKNISKTIWHLGKILDKVKDVASDAGYDFDYVYTNGYGSGFLKNNPIPNDLDYHIFIDLGTFDYNGDKTKKDVANEIVAKIGAFHYYLNSYINDSSENNFYTERTLSATKNFIKFEHKKYVDEIAFSLDDAIKGERYSSHITKQDAKDSTKTIYYMPYVMEPGKLLLKDYNPIILYSDLVSYNDDMPKYERIISLTLGFCAHINHDGKTSYIEIVPDLYSSGPLELPNRLYAPNVFFKRGAIRHVKDLYNFSDDEAYIERLLYCYIDHLQVIYPDKAFEKKPIKIFKRSLQLADMIAPFLGDEEYTEIQEFIYGNLSKRDIQLLNEYDNICDIILRVYKAPILYKVLAKTKKISAFRSALKNVLTELDMRNNISQENMKVLEDYAQEYIFDILSVKNQEERATLIKSKQPERKYLNDVLPVVKDSILKNVTDIEKMNSIVARLKNIYLDSGYRFLNIYVADANTFELEENEFTKSIKDFKDFAQKANLSPDMKFVVLPKDKISKKHLYYEIWFRYNTTKAQDEYYDKLKQALLANKGNFKVRKKLYLVK